MTHHTPAAQLAMQRRKAERPCQQCGRVTAMLKTARYCSNACRQRAKYARAKPTRVLQPLGQRVDPPNYRGAGHGKSSTLYNQYGCRCSACADLRRKHARESWRKVHADAVPEVT